jgi:hypothetical protein
MSFRTSFNFAQTDRPATPDDVGAYDDFGAYASWGERVVTAVAVTLALLFVTTVAVLMSMA